MKQTSKLSKHVGTKRACRELCMPRASYYRFMTPSSRKRKGKLEKKTKSPLALTTEERQKVLDLLHCEKYIDQAPNEIYANLLDHGQYFCSVRTMYRYLSQEGEIKERRNQKRHVKYEKPELLTSRPNQLWSWDITKLKGPKKWNYFHLYVIMDVYSRYVVGWVVANKEQAVLAKQFISETAAKQGINADQLTIHADRGSSMKSKPVALLMSDLGITKTHSRPHTSNDNPYSEAQFKTLKYRPEFPERFGSLSDARQFCQRFFKWYNDEHYHSGIGYLTPKTVHYRLDRAVRQARQAVLDIAYENNPSRFKGKKPKPAELPEKVWINKPKEEKKKEAEMS